LPHKKPLQHTKYHIIASQITATTGFSYSQKISLCYGVCVTKRQKKTAKDQKGDGREQATIDLTDDAAKRVQAFVDLYGGRGMKKVILSRLVKWWAGLPDAAKGAVVGMVAKDVEAAHAAVLVRVADEVDPARRSVRVPAEVYANLARFAGEGRTVEDYIVGIASGGDIITGTASPNPSPAAPEPVPPATGSPRELQDSRNGK
jgi:hypothetical protein